MASIQDKDDEIFDGKTLSDVFEDIYNNSQKRKQDIDDTLDSFMEFIKKNKDVSFIGPVIKDLLHVSVQNDEQLVKMATIVQRIMTNNSSNKEDNLLSEADKEALQKIANKAKDDLQKSLPDDFGELEEVMLDGDAESFETLEISDSEEDEE